MDAKRVIVDTLEEMERDQERALEGLTADELSWRPANWANSIGFTLWHVTRAEDVWVRGHAKGIEELFEQDGWSAKWGIPSGDTGHVYDEAKLAQFPTPPVEELVQYYRAVRKNTMDYLDGLTAEALDRTLVIEQSSFEGAPVGRMFSHLLSEIGQHVGHIRYLRGLQRGLNR